MLYQQGLTELIHSSPSEQVAYLLAERASLLETSEDPDGPLGAETQALNSNTEQVRGRMSINLSNGLKGERWKRWSESERHGS